MILFHDRTEAGEKLADMLVHEELHRPLVLAIPRGGVVVGAAVARRLGAELDVVLSRKLRAPEQPELAIGAVSESGEVWLNPIADDMALGDEYLHQERQHQMQEIEQRRRWIREVRPAADVADRTVIVIDDGVATGSTLLAALQSLSTRFARTLIAAVPVGPADTLRAMGQYCDHVVALHTPRHFHAVGQFYEQFEPVSDEEVVAILRKAHASYATPA